MSFQHRAADFRTRQVWSKALLSVFGGLAALIFYQAFQFYSTDGAELPLLTSILLTAWFLG
ncbi:MAG: hypothetical protein WKF37_21645, partial [Bryobacteraceae bacterium]